jgi:diguanylate cyclase (GGDEF)-like protein
MKPKMSTLVANLEHRSKTFWVLTELLLVALVGFLDFVTGYELAFSLFYLLPISVSAWFSGKRISLIISLVSALTWIIADVTSGQVYSNQAIFFWNTAIRFSFFVIVTLLLSAMKNILEHEQVLSRTDSLTGSVNSRAFTELAQREIDHFNRFQRSFSMVHIDMDEFKMINDQYGHSVGDEVLCAVASEMKNRLRRTDIVSRLAGDEFAILLPETNQASVQVAIDRLHSCLSDEMRRKGWQVTFSIGVVTFLKAPASVDEMIKAADQTMYAVKQHGKDGVKYRIYPVESI